MDNDYKFIDSAVPNMGNITFQDTFILVGFSNNGRI